MNRILLAAIASSLLLASVAANAQTYDLNIGVITGGQPAFTIAGSFNFNSTGTAFCAGVYCSPGDIPQITNVQLPNPLDDGYPPTFSDVTGAQTSGGGSIIFFDYDPSFPPLSSEFQSVRFDFDTPLGGSSSSFNISDIQVCTNGSGCSPNHGGYFCGVFSTTCTSSLTLVANEAPEIDSSSAASGVALLLGGLAVYRGRRMRTKSS